MASKREQERAATRAAKRSGGRPEVSRYASKGTPHKYEFKERDAQRRERW